MIIYGQQQPCIPGRRYSHTYVWDRPVVRSYMNRQTLGSKNAYDGLGEEHMRVRADGTSNFRQLQVGMDPYPDLDRHCAF